MKHVLDAVITDEVLRTGRSRDLVVKLVQRIDEFKVMGFTGGEASSKFGDYLTFLGLPDDEPASEFFARRWTDHRVVTEIPHKLRAYVNNDTPAFTISRIEPQYQKQPFTKQGIPTIDSGSYGLPGAKSPVMEAPRLTEEYLNFIIVENLPEIFYMEADNSRMSEILSTGLPHPGAELPYKLYATVGDARDSLFRDLKTHGRHHSVAALSPVNFTLLEIDSFGLVLDTAIFYTRTLSGHRQGTRAYGYYYEGSLDEQYLSVSKQNTSAS